MRLYVMLYNVRIHTGYPETTSATDNNKYSAFVVVCRVGCLWVTGVMYKSSTALATNQTDPDNFFNLLSEIRMSYLFKAVPSPSYAMTKALSRVSSDILQNIHEF